MAAGDGTNVRRHGADLSSQRARAGGFSWWLECGSPLPTSAEVQSPPRHIKRWHQVAPVRGN